MSDTKPVLQYMYIHDERTPSRVLSIVTECSGDDKGTVKVAWCMNRVAVETYNFVSMAKKGLFAKTTEVRTTVYDAFDKSMAKTILAGRLTKESSSRMVTTCDGVGTVKRAVLKAIMTDATASNHVKRLAKQKLAELQSKVVSGCAGKMCTSKEKSRRAVTVRDLQPVFKV